MRQLFILLLLLGTFTQNLHAQHKSLEYFEKVPTKFYKPGLSPMQSIRFSYQGTPFNQWVKKSGEMKLDLFRIKLSKRSSVIISGAAWAGYKNQSRELYSVNGQQASERTNYYFASPALSTGISYGFFFPYYLNARIGFLKPWEGAYYKATLPIQYSDQDDVQTQESAVEYSEKGFGPVKNYFALELYRPFKAKFRHEHPMGVSVAYTFFPGEESGNQTAWNFGIYWHIKAK